MERLTAKQALTIAKANSADQHIDEILTKVLAAAGSGKTHVKITSCGFGDSAMYGSMMSSLQREVVEALRKLGYSTGMRYITAPPTTAWLAVSWDDAK